MVQIFFGLKNNFQTSIIFYPLSQSMVMNLRQIKKMKLVQKVLNQRII